MTEPFRFSAGTTPLLVSMPHVGTAVPSELKARMTPEALALADTDWHVDRLYDFLQDIGASAIAATFSRYVIDLNRAPDGQPLYPGASETQLCPTSTFAEEPIYRSGEIPEEAEVERRRDEIWQPYHDRLQRELDAIRDRHGIAVLWDAHSIRSEVPRFFDGRLPDLNFGTAEGVSAAADLITGILSVAKEAEDYDHVLDGRFKGGYITRRYGRPADGLHAVQLELSQITYMDEDPPFLFREDLAAKIRPSLRRMLKRTMDWANAEATTAGSKAPGQQPVSVTGRS